MNDLANEGIKGPKLRSTFLLSLLLSPFLVSNFFRLLFKSELPKVSENFVKNDSRHKRFFLHRQKTFLFHFLKILKIVFIH